MSISEIHIMTNYMEKYPGKKPHIQLFFCIKRCKTEINKHMESQFLLFPSFFFINLINHNDPQTER